MALNSALPLPPYPSMNARVRRRYLDVLASIYIYNEHRGYTSLDRVLTAVRARCADDTKFIRQVEKHRADERKHYTMFKRYFQLNGTMPLQVDKTCGHIDRFIKAIFGCDIDDLDTAAVVANGAQFEKLCRVIMLTEQRGMHQVEILLQSRLLRSDKRLLRIFEIIRKDEPSHWEPYRDWLMANGKKMSTLRERATDFWIHKSLMFAKLPALFFNAGMPRELHWRDEADPA